MTKLNIYTVNEHNFVTSRWATLDEANHMREGTIYQREISCSYADILFAIGSETFLGGNNYTTDAEWVIETPKGNATIYNWKNGVNYDEEGGYLVEDIQTWSVGGKTPDVVPYITKLLFNQTQTHGNFHNEEEDL